MNKNKELAKNTLIITIGRISTQFLSFLLLPLYTALLTTEEYGTVDLVNTYSQLLLPIVILQMDQALLRFMILDRASNGNNRKCISTTSIVFLTQAIVFSFLYFVVTRFWQNQYAIYLYLNVLAMCLSSYSLQAARGFGDNVTYSVSSFISGALTIALNVLFIAGLHMKSEGMLIAAIIGNIVASVYILLKDRVYKYISISEFDKSLLKQMLIYAWPLIPNALIWWVVNASDRSIVLLFLGASANGILAVSHKFPSLIMTLYNIFHLSWTESAALHLHEEDRDEFFSSVFDTVFRLASVVSLLLIAIMPFIFNIFINESFSDAYYQIPIYTIASFFNIIVGLYSVVYISNMKTGEIAKTSLFSGIINIVVNIALIRYIGLYAASISSAIAFGTMAIYRAIDIRKTIKQSINMKLLISVLVFFAIGFFVYYQPSYIGKIIYLIVTIVYSVFINKYSIKKIIGFMKSKILEKHKM